MVEGRVLCEENDRVQLRSSPKFPHLVLLKINVMRNRSLVHRKLLWNVCAFRKEIRREAEIRRVTEALFSPFFNSLPVHKLWSGIWTVVFQLIER